MPAERWKISGSLWYFVQMQDVKITEAIYFGDKDLPYQFIWVIRAVYDPPVVSKRKEVATNRKLSFVDIEKRYEVNNRNRPFNFNFFIGG